MESHNMWSLLSGFFHLALRFHGSTVLLAWISTVFLFVAE
jgi:hypothetical protein